MFIRCTETCINTRTHTTADFRGVLKTTSEVKWSNMNNEQQHKNKKKRLRKYRNSTVTSRFLHRYETSWRWERFKWTSAFARRGQGLCSRLCFLTMSRAVKLLNKTPTACVVMRVTQVLLSARMFILLRRPWARHQILISSGGCIIYLTLRQDDKNKKQYCISRKV